MRKAFSSGLGDCRYLAVLAGEVASHLKGSLHFSYIHFRGAILVAVEAYHIDDLVTRIPFLEKFSVNIGLENVWNRFLISPMEWKFYLDEVNHPQIGMYFDVGNCEFQVPAVDFIEILGDKINISSLATIIAIITMGGLYGILGMVIGVPIFAVAIQLIQNWTINTLRNKGLDTSLEYYYVGRSEELSENNSNKSSDTFKNLISKVKTLFSNKNNQTKEK